MKIDVPIVFFEDSPNNSIAIKFILSMCYLAVTGTEAISPPSVTPEYGVILSPKISFKQEAISFPMFSAVWLVVTGLQCVMTL